MSKEWSESEIKLLKKEFKKYSNKELQEKFFNDRTITSIKSKARNLKLNRGEKYSIEHFQKIAAKHGGKCLTTKYNGIKSPLELECSEGHKWTTSADGVNQGKWCSKCYHLRSRRSKESLQTEAKTLCNSNNLQFLKLVKRKRYDTFEAKCKNGHVFVTSITNIKQGYGCKKCSFEVVGDKNRKYKIEEIKEAGKKVGLVLLGETYKSVDHQMHWECQSCGSEVQKVIKYVLKGQGCPECSSGKAERFCRSVFQLLFGEKFPKRKPKWLVSREGNRLELDGYCESLGIAFEHQGMQHYEKNYFHSSTDAFEKLLRNDKLKLQLCKKNGVNLVVVPSLHFKLHPNELPLFIYNTLKDKIKLKREEFANAKVDWSLNSSTTSEYNDYIDFLKKKDLMIYDPYYYGSTYYHTHQCLNCFWVWDAKPDKIKNGNTGCPNCAGSRKILFKEVQEECKKYDHKLLSKEYKNSTSKLEWKCKRGHVFSMNWVDIRKGNGCPICAGRVLSLDQFHEEAMKHGGKCHIKKLVNGATKVKWECKKGHFWRQSLSIIRGGRWCPECGGSRRKTILEIKNEAKQRGFRVLSKKYVNARSNLTFECSKKHVYEQTYDTFKQGGGCKKCSMKLAGEKRRLATLNKLRKMAEKLRGECHTKKYDEGEKTLLSFSCKEGHKFKLKAYQFNRGKWCPKCKE